MWWQSYWILYLDVLMLLFDVNRYLIPRKEFTIWSSISLEKISHYLYNINSYVLLLHIITYYWKLYFTRIYVPILNKMKQSTNIIQSIMLKSKFSEYTAYIESVEMKINCIDMKLKGLIFL